MGTMRAILSNKWGLIGIDYNICNTQDCIELTIQPKFTEAKFVFQKYLLCSHFNTTSWFTDALIHSFSNFVLSAKDKIWTKQSGQNWEALMVLTTF